MGTRVHYPEEIIWEAIKMKQAGKTNKEIMDQLGIKNKTQIKTGCDGTKLVIPIGFLNKLASNIPMVRERRNYVSYNN